MRGAGLAVAGVLLGAAILVAGGRIERRQWADAQNAGIRAQLATLPARLRGAGLARYTVWSGLTCLVYSTPERVYGQELCLDADGRIVEAVDARGAGVSVWSLRPEAGLADARVTKEVAVSAIDFIRDRAVVWFVTKTVRDELRPCYYAATAASQMARTSREPTTAELRDVAGICARSRAAARAAAIFYEDSLPEDVNGGAAAELRLAARLGDAARSGNVRGLKGVTRRAQTADMMFRQALIERGFPGGDPGLGHPNPRD